MRVGFYINPQTPGPADDGRIIEEVLGQVDLAEQIGFDDVWITEHAFTGYNAYSDPMVLAAAISQRNRRLKIGFSIAIAPLHHPIRFVTQCNLLDRLSGGRLVVGIGPGNSPDEFRGYGYEAPERHAMVDEWIEAVEAAWGHTSTPNFSYGEKYWHGQVRGRVIPTPQQQPRPHIAWGTTTLETIIKVGKRGWSLLIGPQHESIVAPRLQAYARAMEEAGLDEATKARAWLDTGQLRQIYCAAPGENWRETIGEYIETYIRKSALANSGIDDLPKDDLERRKDSYLKNWLIAGTAEELIERLTPAARMGIAHLMCWFTFGHMPDALVRQSMLRFAADVAPVLAATKPEPGLVDRMVEEGVQAEMWRPR
ncbi:MAG: LLM class flavin-dependent oxidoreductase [Chloroflexi bacterium]|nr:LLM class flavin-dependent oxidoreductase [Chloroflexota bacterium]GIW09945.1 MAG: monooxygenase [Dehalococcoidia bacterium]